MKHSINNDAQEYVLENLYIDFVKHHFNTFSDTLDFNEYTSNTKTRVTNVIQNGLNFVQDLYLPEFKKFKSNLRIYINLINKAIEDNDIVFAVDTNSNLQCFIGLYDKSSSDNLDKQSEVKKFLIKNNYKEITLDFINPSDLNLLKTYFLMGKTPIIKNKFFNKDYLNIIKDLNIDRCISNHILSVTPANFESYTNIYLRDNAFSGNYHVKFIKDSLDSLFSHFHYGNVKNYFIKEHFNDYLKNHIIDTSNLFSTSENKLKEILSLNFFNQFDEEKFSKVLLSSHIYKINYFINYNSNTLDEVKKQYETLLKSTLDFNIPTSSKIDLKDFKIALFLFNFEIEHKEFQKAFVSKYSQYNTNDFNDILDGIGLNKSEAKKFKKQFAALSFSNDNKYVFNSIKETNIYGVSLDRKDFMLPIEDFTWTNVKYILHNAKNKDFFFSFNDDNLTLGLYSNYSFEFNRNDFVKTIIDTIIDLKTEFANTYPEKNRAYIDYSRMPLELIQNNFEKTIRSFMLNSATQSIKDNVTSHIRKKI